MTEKNREEDIPQPAPLVEVRRGSITESRHRGHIAAVNADDQTIATLGSPDTVTYLRSSAKPHQALPLVASGAADHFGLSESEIAIACGSHSGEPIHTATVQNMLRKLGLDESALKCGIHDPFSREETRKLRERREQPSVLQNNCSGKHAGMLALALHVGAPIETYYEPDSPVQVAIGHTIALFSGVPVEDIPVGIDGCGVPAFAVSIRAMALMYARLVNPPANFDLRTRSATERIVNAMLKYPEMVGGTSERLDTEMIKATCRSVISKIGAEGVYTVGVMPSSDWPRGLGLAMKIEDGEDRRARPTVVIESLRQLGALTPDTLQKLSEYSRFDVKSHSGKVVGEVRPSFILNAAVVRS